MKKTFKIICLISILLTVFSSNKNIICRLKIIKIENYQQEKFGKDSYKLTFLVIQ